MNNPSASTDPAMSADLPLRTAPMRVSSFEPNRASVKAKAHCMTVAIVSLSRLAKSANSEVSASSIW